MVKVIAVHAKDHPEEPYFVRVTAEFRTRAEAYDYVRGFPPGVRPHVIRATHLEGGARRLYEGTFAIQFGGPWGSLGLERLLEHLESAERLGHTVRWIGAANGTRYNSLEDLKAGLHEREKMEA